MDEENSSRFKELLNRFEGNCFGCSPNNDMGLKMKFLWDEQTIRSELKVPSHFSGWNQLIHGGVASTILDEVMSWAAIYSTRQMVMTKNMTIEFVKPIQIGNEITAEGRVLEIIGRHELKAEGCIYNDQKQVCVKSSGKFVIFNQKVAKRLGIVHKDTPDPFENEKATNGIGTN